MLDFNKLIGQIDQVGQDSLSENLNEQETLDNAHDAFDKAKEKAEEFEQRLADNEKLVLWPVGRALERFGNSYEVQARKEPVTVVAVDGSQIMPSHHEVHTCYLLNIGLALVTYGEKHAPILESVPRLFHRPEDLYPLVDRRRIHIDELYVSLERTLLEMSALLERGREAQNRGVPVVAFFDGSLISWSVEKLPESYQLSYNQRMVDMLEAFRLARIPILGYLSHSRGADVINMLRVSICPYETSNCRELCRELNEEDFPCSKIWPMSDRALFGNKLAAKKRSAAFSSGSKAAKSLPLPHQICFAYLNTGFEVARLEFPHWVFADGELLKLACSTALAQAEKGMGYPVCLSEAHHLAVIRGKDREQFFELITRHLVGLGVRRVRVSPKESKKRTGFV